MRLFTASVCIAAAIILCQSAEAQSSKAKTSQRIVVLAPAAADVLMRLDVMDSIVGVTNSVSGFPLAVNVGTYMNPGLESIAALNPTLIIAGTRFNPAYAARIGAEFFLYDPRTLDDIISLVRSLARAIGKEAQGKQLADELQAILDGLQPPRRSVSVLYETRATPLSLARNNTIIRDMLERAGMRYLYDGSAWLVSMEYLISAQPDVYIYQHGPMNRNPIPPARRPGWDRFAACAWMVDEFDFARPNTRLFETLQMLNAILHQDDICAAGKNCFQLYLSALDLFSIVTLQFHIQNIYKLYRSLGHPIRSLLWFLLLPSSALYAALFS